MGEEGVDPMVVDVAAVVAFEEEGRAVAAEEFTEMGGDLLAIGIDRG
jgi:hypothetical protein